MTRTLLIAATLALYGCGTTSDPSTADTSSTTPTTIPSTAAADTDEYCAAVADILGSQPAGQFTDPTELSAAFNDYADTIEQALPSFPDEDASILSDVVQANRAYANDTESPEALEGLSEVSGPLFTVNQRAANVCGVDFVNDATATIPE